MVRLRRNFTQKGRFRWYFHVAQWRHLLIHFAKSCRILHSKKDALPEIPNCTSHPRFFLCLIQLVQKWSSVSGVDNRLIFSSWPWKRLTSKSHEVKLNGALPSEEHVAKVASSSKQVLHRFELLLNISVLFSCLATTENSYWNVWLSCSFREMYEASKHELVKNGKEWLSLSSLIPATILTRKTDVQ